MIGIVNHITPKIEEDSREAVMKTAEGIEQDTILRCDIRMVVSYGY
jgi:hypothetical protein